MGLKLTNKVARSVLPGFKKTFLLLSIVFACFQSALAFTGTDSIPNPDSLNKKRFVPLVTIAGAGYASSMTALYALWYKDYQMRNFHLINDNKQWLQMDKAGHLVTSYAIGKIGYDALRWSGVKESKSVLYGGLTGWVYLTTIEVFDGFSEGWGASTGDMLANTAGTVLFVSQQLVWQDQKVTLKYSYYPTKYAKFYPASLGSTPLECILKDYNGQTYWLSANISAMGLQQTRFPKWLSLAFGYGIDGVTGAYGNVSVIPGESIPMSARMRQFYIAPDIDLSRLPVKSKTLKLILNAIGFIKFPMPALELNRDGVKFKPLYF